MSGVWPRVAAAVVVAAVLGAAPFVLKPSGVYLMSYWAVTTIAALGLNLTLGYAGQISLAQGAFVGIGAYTVAITTAHAVPFAAAFVLAGALSFAIGWLLGYPALRVQHHYLAFVTLAFSTVAFLVMRNEEWLTGGVYGINGIARPSLWDVGTLREPFGWSVAQARAVDFYVISLAILALFSAVLWWIIRSPWGRAFVALRENPTRALSLGVDTRRYTLMAFAIGSCFGGCAGAIYAPLVQFIEPNSFALGLSLNLLLMVIVGGSGYFLGPFAGGLVAILAPEWLRFTEGYYLLIYALLVMVLMAICPTGLIGLAERAANVLSRARAVRTAPATGTSGTETALP
jgi:branched-chain amino acid transport system permease protein